jgi:hypothetical protein
VSGLRDADGAALVECGLCSGFGSSLHEVGAVCSGCGGSGLVLAAGGHRARCGCGACRGVEIMAEYLADVEAVARVRTVEASTLFGVESVEVEARGTRGAPAVESVVQVDLFDVGRGDAPGQSLLEDFS